MSATTVRPERTKGARRPLGASPRKEPPAPPTLRRVLIATDGSRAAGAAIKLARIFSTRGDWTPSVVTVLEPMPVAVGDVVLAAPPSQVELVVTDSLVASIKNQLKRYGDVTWEFRTEFGRPASQIVRAATDAQAELIVLGLGRHGRLARLLGAETAARVARHAPVPVLAVHPRTWATRTVAVAAVDFGEASVRAAREALALLEAPARLHLLHVRSSFNTTSFAETKWQDAYAAAAEEEFNRLRQTLGSRPGIAITTELAAGHVVDTILHVAKKARAQFVALGSHSESMLERVMIGSTPTEILRAAPCSVLIAPLTNASHAKP